MFSRFSRLIVLLGVVAIALYIVLLNNSEITIFLAPESPLTGNAGVILISSFVLGILFMASVALWFGMKAYFRERGLKARDKQRQAFYEGMLKARNHYAAGELQKAKESWEAALKKDPTDVIARVELSETLEAMADEGRVDPLEALRVLDAARAADPKNIEILFRACKINLALNNRTAALDNLNLILYHHPTKSAARLARNVAEELGRIEDAFEYQKQLEALSEESGDREQVLSRLNFKKLLQEDAADAQLLKERLRNFIKKHSNYAPAIIRLAELEADQGKLDEAAQLYVKASRVPEFASAWHMAARLWLKANLPDKAIAAAKVATAESKGDARIRAEIELIRLYIALSMLDAARKHLDGFPFLMKREGVSRSGNIMSLYLSLKGLCLSRMGEYQQSADIFKKLCEQEPELQDFIKEMDLGLDKEGPAPRLSTP